jgi:hypothetical protein
MLTKTKIGGMVLATALTVGTACAALASNENDGGNETGGYRILGSGGVVADGVNPAYHRSLRVHPSNAYAYVPGYAPRRRDHVKK